ncbi:protein of unknown function [Friedmanniella luteola]|uniref:DUF1206 domain-containing protein n=1 Tax=Friedmanniella luteola TaxID=546871 RepID=A0A1H1TUE9_9ACTN|nr:DUF1206 domain-containing protein [Friedmanniella luteola]SDS63822.1 protein of unknown function [Friedmanniella luteola]
MSNAGVAGQAAEGARDASQQMRGSRGYQVLVAVGLVCYGVVHLLIAWIALRVAWGGGGDASQEGALRALAKTGAGPLLLGVVAVGMLALVLWQAAEAAFGYGRVAQEHDERRRLRKRLSSAGRAVVYLLIGVSAARLVAGAGSSGGQEDTLTGRLLQAPFGRALVVLVAAAILAVGVSQVVRGVRQKFTEDLEGDRTRAVRVLGTAGYVAKGVALAVVAGLFGWAALSADPDRAGGLDAALHTVASQPQGSSLLTVLAAGFAAFGLFCFVWARNARS